MPKNKSLLEKHPGISLVVILAVFFLILDIVLGIFLVPRKYQEFRRADAYYHHGLKPNQESFGRWATSIYPFNTNSIACRDSTARKVPLQTPGKTRVLFLGDSHAEGVDVPFEKTFVGILGKEVDKEKYDIINASVVSYSPKISYLKAKYLIEEKGLQVDKIFMLIDISDIQNELVYEPFEPATNPWATNQWMNCKAFLKRNSFFVYSIQKIINAKERKAFSKAATNIGISNNQVKNTEPVTLDIYYSFFTHFNDEVLLANPRFHGVGNWLKDPNFRKLALKGIQLGQENTLRLHEFCKKHEIELAISVHPWHPQIIARDTHDEYVKSWEKFALDNHINFINLFPVFINEQNPAIVIKKYYLKSDNHWNSEGHKLVAGHLQKILF